MELPALRHAPGSGGAAATVAAPERAPPLLPNAAALLVLDGAGNGALAPLDRPHAGGVVGGALPVHAVSVGDVVVGARGVCDAVEQKRRSYSAQFPKHTAGNGGFVCRTMILPQPSCLKMLLVLWF